MGWLSWIWFQMCKLDLVGMEYTGYNQHMMISLAPTGRAHQQERGVAAYRKINPKAAKVEDTPGTLNIVDFFEIFREDRDDIYIYIYMYIYICIYLHFSHIYIYIIIYIRSHIYIFSYVWTYFVRWCPDSWLDWVYG